MKLNCETKFEQRKDKGSAKLIGELVTGKGNGAVDGENSGMTADVTELGVGIAGKYFAAIAAEKLDGGGGVERGRVGACVVIGRSGHKFVCNEREIRGGRLIWLWNQDFFKPM